MQRSVVRSPRLFARRPRRRHCRREQPSHRKRAQRDDGPHGRRSGKHGPSRDKPREHRDGHEASSQIVDHLPPRESGERIAAGTAREDERQKLPVAANPPLLPLQRRQIARGIFVEYLDVGHESRARVRALDQVVTQQRILREAIESRALERGDIVDSLAGVRALTEEILIDIGHCRRVGIDTGVAGEDRGEAGSIRALQRYAYARLQDAVPLNDARAAVAENGAVERMRDRSDQRGRCPARKKGVGVECDDVAHAREPRDLALDRRECFPRPAAQIRVELPELSPLSLPAHPDTLRLVSSARALEKVERRGLPVFAIQRAHALHRRLDDRSVARQRLGRGVGEVAEQRKTDLRISIGEELRLEMIERVARRGGGVEEERNGYDGSLGYRHTVLRIVQASHPVGTYQDRRELIDYGDANLARWQECDEQCQRAHAPRGYAGQRCEHGRKHGENCNREHAEVEQRGSATPQSSDALRERGLIVERALERWSATANEIVTDVSHAIALVARLGSNAVYRGALQSQADCGSRHGWLGQSRLLGQLLNRVTVEIACIEGHRGVESGRIVTQHRFRCAQGLDEVGPCKACHRAKARDAVRHHELRQRQSSCRALNGRLHAHRVLGDPLLEPEGRGEIAAGGANLLKESREERCCHLRRMCDEVRELTPQLSVTARRAAKATNLRVGSLGVHHITLCAKRHSTHIFQQPHAEHHWPGPELSQRQRLDALILT